MLKNGVDGFSNTKLFLWNIDLPTINKIMKNIKTYHHILRK